MDIVYEKQGKLRINRWSPNPRELGYGNDVIEKLLDGDLPACFDILCKFCAYILTGQKMLFLQCFCQEDQSPVLK